MNQEAAAIPGLPVALEGKCGEDWGLLVVTFQDRQEAPVVKVVHQALVTLQADPWVKVSEADPLVMVPEEDPQLGR